ncbi:MAG: hypothetical protein M3N53_01895 [Actinomycetota bacterium]|nr:hypothetical protein [Actinomycetota bacterium]
MRSTRARSGYITLATFLVVIVGVEAGARLLAPSLPIDPGKWPRIEIAQKLNQIRHYANEGQQVDVVFAGSSMMAGGVDAVAFTEASGASSYNAAFAGPSMRTVTPWVVDIVQPLLSPEVVVVGIQSRELSDNGPKNLVMYEKFVASPGYKQATGSIVSRLEGELENLSYFMRYRRALREPGQLFQADSEQSLAEAATRQVIGPRGTRLEEPREYHRPPKLIRGLYEKTLVDFAVGGPEYQALVDLERELSARGVRLVLLNMPVTDDYWEAHEDAVSDRLAYHEALTRFVSETGVTLIDAEGAFGTPAAFRDPVHLDVEGRRSLAVALADRWWDIMDADGAAFLVACGSGADPECRVEPDPAGLAEAD